MNKYYHFHIEGFQFLFFYGDFKRLSLLQQILFQKSRNLSIESLQYKQQGINLEGLPATVES